MEYLLIKRILNDTAILRYDEYEMLLMHLLENTENVHYLKNEDSNLISNYESPHHNKALLKMHGDLAKVIRNKSCINIKYVNSKNSLMSQKLLPCEIKYDLGYLYLIAYKLDVNDKLPMFYRIDYIQSFEILYDQSAKEQQRVKNYLEKYSNDITQMYGGEYIEIKVKCQNEFYPYIYDKFKTVEVLSNNDQHMILKIFTFEYGFIKWIMSQSPNKISIIYPDNMIEKIKKEAAKILDNYGGI